MSGSARCICAQKVSASDFVLKRTLFRICPARHCTHRHMVLVIVCPSAAALPCPGVPLFVCPFLCCISPCFPAHFLYRPDIGRGAHIRCERPLPSHRQTPSWSSAEALPTTFISSRRRPRTPR